MLMKGAKINAKAGNGATPLMLAVQYGNTESARMLAKHNADLTC